MLQCVLGHIWLIRITTYLKMVMCDQNVVQNENSSFNVFFNGIIGTVFN